jgi:selenide, water dikinase
VLALVHPNVDSGALHPPARLVVARQGDRDPRTEREHVRAHRLELLVGSLDQLDPALIEELDEANRHERQVDDSQVDVERREKRHEVHDLAWAVIVGQVEGHDLDSREKLAERVHARLVRPVAQSDEERALVQPDDVSALGERRGLEPPRDRNARLDEVGCHRIRLPTPPLLARAQEDGAGVGDDGRIVGVDGVGIGPVRRFTENDLGAVCAQKRAEGFVLLCHGSGVGLEAPTVGLPEGRVLGPRCPDEDASEPGCHALTAKLTGGNLHQVEGTARLTGLEAGGGCAAKYSAARLEELLAGFLPSAPENLLVGLAPADDAAVYKLDDDRALIFTTDFFPPMVEDPSLFGAIAAANALNDVFAMGGRPLLALSIAAFPEELPVSTVRAIFDAAAAKVQEAGAVLAGGHTIRDVEPKYGLAVVGTVHPEALWRKSGARPGDVLFLTKPLGTGLVLAAAAKGLVGDDDAAETTRRMTELNDRAADLVRGFDPGAVTDVTGFGLFGHAHEVAERSGARLRLEAASLPALPGALEAASHGIRTGGDARNRDFAAHAVALNGAAEEVVALGFDPQTAGGLLVSLPADKAAVLEARFRADGSFLARIGKVEEGSGVTVS